MSQLTGFRRWIAFVAVILGYFMALLDTTIVHVTLPEMTRHFHTTMDNMSWIVNGYNLVFAVFLVTASRIADQFGRKRLFLIGTALFIATSILCGLSSSVEAMVFFRVLQGLSAAIVVPVTIPLAANLFPKEKHGMVLGIWGAISSLAAASGPTLGGILTDSIGWEAIFFVNVPIGIAAIGLTIPLVRESMDASAGRRLDWLGMLTLSASLFFLTFGLINVSDWGWNSVKLIGSFAAFLVCLILFLAVERRTAEPMLPLWLLRIVPFNGAVLALMVLGAGMTATSYLMSYFLTGILGHSVLHAGVTISAMSLTSMVISAIAGGLSNKYGSRWFVAAGVAVLALSVYLDGSLTVNSTEWSVIWRLALSGVGIGLSIAPVMGASIRNVPEEKVGIASGITNMSRAIDSVLGVAILVSVLNGALNHYGADIAGKENQRSASNAVLSDEAKQVLLERAGRLEQRPSPVDATDAKNAEEQDAFVASFRHTFHVAGWLLLPGIPFALISDRRRGQRLASGSSTKNASQHQPQANAP
ncbi:MFS transporter [Paenibacillus flagellatus]|uniref:MFS transporter n=1 Tax=Paenibacillus flagellatus TaxID=2211139 RepID=A0A2V5K1N0_9BACL|nr:MFS transporter [Paenibacillus flagellatus]PYI53058.1 MFS transporter [Paenibacillus flagellatus]